MGRVQLEVLFGKKGNSRHEPIWFEVVDISSPYHALLGRPALGKFMAVPHYAYLKMKLPGPRGVITVSGCFKKSLACAKASSQLAEALVIAEEKRQLLHRVELTQQDMSAHQYFSPVGGLGVGVVFTSPKGDKLQYVLQIHFRASNNVAEYEALVHGLKLAKEIGSQRILCFGDSDLVVHQVSGEWDAKDANMASYRFYVQQLCGFFEGCEFYHVPRANNDEADRLSKIGSTKQDIPAGVSLEIIRKPSIKPSPESGSIFVPEDPAPAQMTLPDSGAAALELEEAADQPSAAGSVKYSGAAVSRLAPTAGQPDGVDTSMDPGAADPLVASVFHIREIPS
jgi:ribonuclease HI